LARVTPDFERLCVNIRPERQEVLEAANRHAGRVFVALTANLQYLQSESIAL
jgi:hypothetical protein